MTGDTAYSQGYAQSVLQSQTWRTADNSAAYVLDYLDTGTTVLDVGCGTGTITLDLARRVDPGTVLGVDTEPEVINQAQHDARDHGFTNVSFEVADALDLAATVERPGTGFDVVHAHQLLLHLADPVEALRGMLEMARPGGIVAARDTDYAAMAWWPQDARLDHWLALYRDIAHDHGGEPDAGRRLLGWARAAGAAEVSPSASVWLHATAEERERWGGMWEQRILNSAIAEEALSSGRATAQELHDISAAWREWADHPDGWFLIPHGEIVCWAS